MSDSRMRDDEPVAHHADDPVKPSATDVRAELDRILASRCFQQAGRASDFLRFVVEQTLAGGSARLKGYTIGVEVFGRPADFDAQSDALVRVEAGRLRRRLVEYYASEGAADPVRIELPRGSYAVEYGFSQPVADTVPAVTSAPAATKPTAAPAPWRSAAAVLAVLLVVAGGVIAWQRSALHAAQQSLEALDEPQRTEWPRIVVVPFENLGADAALDVIAASMTEEIMLRLDELDLFVVASQASWYGPSHEKSFNATAAGGYLLTGSVRGTPDRARITVRLIEAGSGTQLWTAAYDESLVAEQLPVLQEQVARDVAAIAAPYGPIFEAELGRARRSVQAPKLRDCVVTYYDYRRHKDPDVYRNALLCFRTVSARQPDVGRRLVRPSDALHRQFRRDVRPRGRRRARRRTRRDREGADARPQRLPRQSRADARPILRRRSRVPPQYRPHDRAASEQLRRRWRKVGSADAPRRRGPRVAVGAEGEGSIGDAAPAVSPRVCRGLSARAAVPRSAGLGAESRCR